ncbi:hypothetical protein Pint_24080 [Pistacia integerrima]|uniref:Uncharacterized protein n=1 Tax=Pistacia integerrima TaxID=434235 RepID=A0ACC0YJI5_9ROSI|nr:hypothetical protein Pint_24080 [Pistacia integerrima]
MPSSSSRVADNDAVKASKDSSSKPKRKSSKKSSGAPIVVSYFPVNSYMSRLLTEMEEAKSCELFQVLILFEAIAFDA